MADSATILLAIQCKILWSPMSNSWGLFCRLFGVCINVPLSSFGRYGRYAGDCN